jgi:hypothetical protein
LSGPGLAPLEEDTVAWLEGLLVYFLKASPGGIRTLATLPVIPIDGVHVVVGGESAKGKASAKDPKDAA